jgi:UDP-N-acetyl-2-amino-2-deoxyglucuronate dehydrogenase
MAFTHDWHTWVLEDFAAALSEGRAPADNRRKALAAHDLIDAIITSARSGRFIYGVD